MRSGRARGQRIVGCGGASKGYCVGCSPGTFVDGGGECEDCAAGQYSATEYAGSCLACPAGKHKSATKAFFCDACEPGRFGSGAVSQDAAAYCQPCAAGQIQKASGTTSCEACASGQYQPATGQTGCLSVQRCRKGTFQAAAATTSAFRKSKTASEAELLQRSKLAKERSEREPAKGSEGTISEQIRSVQAEAKHQHDKLCEKIDRMALAFDRRLDGIVAMARPPAGGQDSSRK